MNSNIFIPDVSNNSLHKENNENIDKKNIIPFWVENPNVLFQQNYIFEFFPIDSMSYSQKLNAISRTVIILTIVAFLFTKNVRTVLIGAITMAVIYIMYYYHGIEESKKDIKKIKEGFSGPALAYYTSNNIQLPDDVFDTPDSSNPFNNVLMTDYDYNPNKKPAPPSFNENINSQILHQAKQLVVEANPDQPDIADKLFKDLGEQLVFEQSLRPFNANPSTTIPNDQGAFAEFCYGSMISCKEGNAFACARNLSHYTNY
jgi:hypothetical protein